MRILSIKKKYLFFLMLNSFFFLSNHVNSQHQHQNNTTEEPCGFSSILEEKLKDPEFLKEYQAHNLQISSYLKKPREKSGSPSIIPIVVHILHKGEPIGVGTNISDAQIISSIDNLNDVFSNSINGGISVDMGVQFVLAKRDPECNSTNGIIRVDASNVPGYSSNGVNRRESNGADDEVLKDLSKWPTSKYMNFWIVSEIDGNDGGAGVQGYANLPVAIDEYNGAVMMSSVFGYDPNGTSFSSTMSSFNNDNSTVTHEVGHFLDLYHPFKDGDTGVCPPNESDCSSEGDFVCDTPPIMNYLGYDNNTIYFNCPSGTSNICSSGNLDEIMHNIMNYTSCPDRFTAGQKDRVQACLATSRASLINSLGAVEPSGVYTAPISSCSSITTGQGLIGNFGGIIDVKLNGFINSSSTTSIDNPINGYMDFTTSCLNVITLQENQNYDLNVSTHYNSHYVKAWIDFNNDGDFDDLGEEITQNGGILSASGAEVTQNFTVPANSVVNTYLRMRVKAEISNSSFTSCSGLTYGQTEDYTIIIESSCDNSIANAGVDASICDNENYTLSASAENGLISWVSSGNGTFDDPTIENPVYTPNNDDILNGSVVLTMNVTNQGGCSDDSDDITLNIFGLPSANAGSDDLICESSSFIISATSENGSILWSTSGDGTFNDNTSENPTYTPGDEDVVNGFATLTMTVSNGSCSDASDDLLLTIDKVSEADAGVDASICSTSTFTASANATNGTILWSTSGDVDFNGNTSENPIYTPGDEDIANGNLTLTMTVTNPGVCSNATDDIELSITGLPSADAGIDQTICETETVTALSTISNGTILWTSLGDGEFDDATIEEAVYTPGVNDISNGSATLIVTVSSGGCSDDTDNFLLTIDNVSEADAGNNESICSSLPFYTTNSSVTNGLINWTTNGTGDFTDPTVENVVYTPSIDDVNAGTVTLTLNVTNPGACPNLSDVLVLSFGANSSADAGLDQTICSNTSFTANASGTDGVFLWSTNGTGDFSDPTIEDAVYTPSNSDINLGVVTLTLDVTNQNGCLDDSDDLVLTIDELPSATFVTSMNQSFCLNNTVQIESNTSGGNISWSSTGDGVIVDPTIQNITYSPGNNDVSSGQVTFTLNVSNGVICPTVSEQITIEITEGPSVPTVNLIDTCGFSKLEILDNGDYTWSNGQTTNSITVTQNGVYSVYETIGNCESSPAVLIATPLEIPNVSLVPLNDMCESDSKIILTGGTPVGGEYSYDGNVVASFSPSVAGVGTHLITYSFDNGNGCVASASSTFEVGCTDLDENSLENEVKLFPNPTNDMLNIISGELILEVVILDQSGRIVDKFDARNNNLSRNVSNLNSGVYYIEIKTESNNKKMKFTILH